MISLWLAIAQATADTPLPFQLPDSPTPWQTSAAIYRPDNSLVRSLWSLRPLPAGSNTLQWNDLDNDGKTVPTGSYELQVTHHQMQYQGEDLTGPIVKDAPALISPFNHGIQAMIVSGTNAFFCQGEASGVPPFGLFHTTDPTRQQLSFGTPDPVHDNHWIDAATDDIRVYFACENSFNPTNNAMDGPGLIVAHRLPGLQADPFTAISNNPSGALSVGSQPGLSGIAVQRRGRLLAAAASSENTIYLFDKISGATLGRIYVSQPGRLCFGAEGDLWAISGRQIVNFADLNGFVENNLKMPTRVEMSSFVKPLAIALSPDGKYLLVVDGGASQQIKAVQKQGKLLWTAGLEGGYALNGPDVSNDKFHFEIRSDVADAYVAFEPGGSFWIGDAGNYRCLRFAASMTQPPIFADALSWMPHTTAFAVDPNRPTRLTCGFLEWETAYDKLLLNSWKLVRNWSANLPDYCRCANAGLKNTTTLANGRIYAMVSENDSGFIQDECVELTRAGLRFTGMRFLQKDGLPLLAPDGSLQFPSVTNANVYLSRPLKGFTPAGDPTWPSQRTANTTNSPAASTNLFYPSSTTRGTPVRLGNHVFAELRQPAAPTDATNLIGHYNDHGLALGQLGRPSQVFSSNQPMALAALQQQGHLFLWIYDADGDGLQRWKIARSQTLNTVSASLAVTTSVPSLEQPILPVISTNAGQTNLSVISTNVEQAILSTTPFPTTNLYPLKISSNGRYLVTVSNQPFLYNADIGWNIFHRLTREQVVRYLDDRQSKGFNTIQAQLLPVFTTNQYDVQPLPLTNMTNLATTNEAFFKHVDEVLQLAAQRNIQLLIAPAWLGNNANGWHEILLTNGATNCHQFGRFLGQRYKNTPNLMWLLGGGADPGPSLESVRALALGIRAADTNHLMTAQAGSPNSASDVYTNETWLDINTTHTWSPDIIAVDREQYHVYAAALRDFARAPVKPFFLVESACEKLRSSTPQMIRRQAYWSLLSGASGHAFGNYSMQTFRSGWETNLNSQGARDLAQCYCSFSSRPWHRLVPDLFHQRLVAGFGTSDVVADRNRNHMAGFDYVTAAAAPDGSLMIAYLPVTPMSLTVDMSTFTGPVNASWQDPISGSNQPVARQTLVNRGQFTFISPGKNSAGDTDWLLILESAATPSVP